MFFYFDSYDDDNYRYNGGGGYTDSWGNPRYENMAPASQAALRREATAKEKFRTAKSELEESMMKKKKNDTPLINPGEKHTITLLQPDVHLTKHTWGTFKRYVKTHAGWDAKRRLATPEEKKKSGEKRKGKVYFTDIVFTAPSNKKTKAAASTIAPTAAAAATTTVVVEDAKLPASKKQKLGDSTNA